MSLNYIHSECMSSALIEVGVTDRGQLGIKRKGCRPTWQGRTPPSFHWFTQLPSNSNFSHFHSKLQRRNMNKMHSVWS